MKHLATILMLLAFAFLANAQSDLDSLWTVWNDKTQSDTARLKAMHNIAWPGYIYKRPDSAFYFAQLEYDLAEEIGNEKWMAKALNSQGGSCFLRGKYDDARQLFDRSLELSTKVGDIETSTQTLNNLGALYDNTGDLDNAMKTYLKGIELSKELQDTFLLAGYYNNLGLTNDKQGRLDLAIENFTKALQLNELIGEEVRTAFSLANIGYAYKSQGDVDRAVEYLQRSMKIYEEHIDDKGNMRDVRSYAMAKYNLANTYSGKGDTAIARQHYFECLETFRKVRDRKSEAKVLKSLGRLFEDQRDLDRAESYMRQSLEISQRMRDKESVAYVENDLSYVYRKRGDIKKAIELSERTLATGREIGAARVIRAASRSLHRSYKQAGISEKSLEMYELYITMRDSIKSETNQRELMRQEYKYQYEKEALTDSLEFAKKEAVLEERTEKQRIGLFAAGSGLFLVIALAFAIYIGKKKSDELLLNILPYETAQELKQKGSADAKLIDEVTVIFTDFKGFTALSEQLSPQELVEDLNVCFSEFDRIMEKYGIEKIKTIGDAYMAAGGLPTPNSTHAADCINAALEMREFVEAGKAKKIVKGLPYFEVRIGVHTGPVVAGIVGIKKFQYDIWGDTVNTASRMESSGEVGRVNISQTTYELLKNDSQLKFESRGKVAAKGKGEIDMYFVEALA